MLKTRLLSVFALGFASALVASACSDDDPSAAETFINDYCNLMMPCCKQAGLSSDPSDCKGMLAAFTMGASYNESKGNECIAAMRAASSSTEFCSMDDDVINDNGACNDVFSSSGSSGNVQPGGKCEMDSDCASTAQGDGECYYYWENEVSYEVCMIVAVGQADSGPCIGTRSGNMTMYSSSGAPPTMGYICDEADGLYCDSDSEKCVAMRPIGAACSYSDRCVEAAYCDSSTGECAAKVAIGSTCTSSYGEECVDTAYCDETTMQCTARRADGAACTASRQCLSDMCSNDECEANADLGMSLICGG